MFKRPQKEYNMENKILLQFLSDAVQYEIFKFQIFFLSILQSQWYWPIGSTGKGSVLRSMYSSTVNLFAPFRPFIHSSPPLPPTPCWFLLSCQPQKL